MYHSANTSSELSSQPPASRHCLFLLQVSSPILPPAFDDAETRHLHRLPTWPASFQDRPNHGETAIISDNPFRPSTNTRTETPIEPHTSRKACLREARQVPGSQSNVRTMAIRRSPTVGSRPKLGSAGEEDTWTPSSKECHLFPPFQPLPTLTGPHCCPAPLACWNPDCAMDTPRHDRLFLTPAAQYL